MFNFLTLIKSGIENAVQNIKALVRIGDYASKSKALKMKEEHNILPNLKRLKKVCDIFMTLKSKYHQ